MLHDIDDNGTMLWHCHNPKCSKHNCSEWHKDIHCDHHQKEKRVSGDTNQTHVSHDDVRWVDHNMIELPTCECGKKMAILIPPPEEYEPTQQLIAQLTRDKDGNIANIHRSSLNPPPPFAMIEKRQEVIPPDQNRINALGNQLAEAKTQVERQYIVKDLIEAVQTRSREIIVDVRLHPAIRLHAAARDAMLNHGKTPPSSQD